MTAVLPDINRQIILKLFRRRLFRKLLNYVSVELQAWAGSRFSVGKPYWLTVDPASFCQLKCPFCPTGAGRDVRPKTIMDIGLFRKLMRELGPFLLHVDFMNWGEPLLNPRLAEMVALSKNYGVETTVSTNLNHLPPGKADDLVACGLDRLVISLDGASQETYEKYRIGGDFAAVIRNLKEIRRARREAGVSHPTIIWQFLVFRHNEHEIDLARSMAAELGVDEIGFTAPCLPPEPGIRENWMARDRKYCLYPPESFPDIQTLQPAGTEDGNIKQKIMMSGVYAGTEERKSCKWPWAGLTINADGSVSPCCSVEERHFDFGDMIQESLGQIWNNARYKEARRHIRRFKNGRGRLLPDSDHICKRCFSIGKANFQLPAWWESSWDNKAYDPLKIRRE